MRMLEWSSLLLTESRVGWVEGGNMSEQWLNTEKSWKNYQILAMIPNDREQEEKQFGPKKLKT